MDPTCRLVVHGLTDGDESPATRQNSHRHGFRQHSFTRPHKHVIIFRVYFASIFYVQN